jgi:hypothetical protein
MLPPVLYRVKKFIRSNGSAQQLALEALFVEMWKVKSWTTGKTEIFLDPICFPQGQAVQVQGGNMKISWDCPLDDPIFRNPCKSAVTNISLELATECDSEPCGLTYSLSLDQRTVLYNAVPCLRFSSQYLSFY